MEITLSPVCLIYAIPGDWKRNNRITELLTPFLKVSKEK